MTAHAENTLRSARIAQIINLSLTTATSEAASTERLVAGQDGQVLDLVATCATAVGTIVADE